MPVDHPIYEIVIHLPVEKVARHREAFLAGNDTSRFIDNEILKQEKKKIIDALVQSGKVESDEELQFVSERDESSTETHYSVPKLGIYRKLIKFDHRQ